MPFYILKISEYGTKETMLWIGLIMGVSPLVTAVAAPFWGSLTTRIRPKLLYQAGTFFNGVIFLLMGFAGSLLAFAPAALPGLLEGSPPSASS